MALEFVVDSIESVPEHSRKFYSEKDGKFHLDEVLAENIKGLKSAVDAERLSAKNNARALKDLEAKYSGVDPDKFRALMNKMESDGDAKLIADGKIDELVQKRIEKLMKEENRQKEELRSKLASAEAIAKAFSDRVLDDSLRAAALRAGLTKPGVIRDSMLMAKTIFSLDENGNTVQKRSDGSIVIGKDGKTQFSADEWYDAQKIESPHWFSVSSSGSPHSGGAGSVGGKTIKRAVFDSMSPHEKAATIKNGIIPVD